MLVNARERTRNLFGHVTLRTGNHHLASNLFLSRLNAAYSLLILYNCKDNMKTRLIKIVLDPATAAFRVFHLSKESFANWRLPGVRIFHNILPNQDTAVSKAGTVDRYT